MDERARILVVDDAEGIRKTLATILREEGYVVDTAENGQEAIEKTHINFYREVKVGEPLQITTQLLGLDEKRLHFFHTMFHGGTGDLLADLGEILSYPFMVNALIAGTVVALVAGVVGWFVVTRSESFAAHTLAVEAGHSMDLEAFRARH